MRQGYRLSILVTLLLLLLIGLSLSGCASTPKLVPVAVDCPQVPDVSQEPWMKEPVVTDFSDLYRALKPKPLPSSNAGQNGSGSNDPSLNDRRAPASQ